MALALLGFPSLCVGFSQVLRGRHNVNQLSFVGAPPLITPSIVGARYTSVVCGRGDKRTAKGKRFRHSFGNARPKNKNKGRGLPPVPFPPRPPKKDPFNSGEHIEIKLDETLFAN